MVYNTLELMKMHTLTSEPAAWQQDFPGSGQQWRLKMRKGSLSGLDLLEGPLWFEMSTETMLVSMVHADAQALMKPEIREEGCSLCCCLKP